LRRRGARILEEAAGVSLSAAEHVLRQSGHNLPVALVMLKTGASAPDARRRLAETSGNVRESLEKAGKLKTRVRGRK
jgi:N-acetylmuramic acid 6-phosphate etherase